ncbi:hypothetical protein [Piscinibacter sp.]|uniref:hypothetical protein n=1 Tax=Piscinibacter sp. TaxID=1903157 RepID=UPI0039E31828
MRCFALALLLCATAPARAEAPPGFAELEARGARVGTITVHAGPIFDADNPDEDKALFRLANRLHVTTRPGVVARALLFASGEPLSARLIEESERLLRADRQFYDVAIRPVALHDDGTVDIEVATRDTWSFDPGLSVGHSGGETTGGFSVRDYNVLGTGTSIALGRAKDAERTSTEFEFSNERAFGTRAAFLLQHATRSDGRRHAVSLVRPFYALDARWSAGASVLDDTRIDRVYQAGDTVARYHRGERRAELFGALSPGLRDGWVQRWALGLGLRDDTYALDPELPAPPVPLPEDRRLRAPFVRFELVEDRFERELNRNLIGRPEFFALGLAARVQVGKALPGLGSTRRPWLYGASVARGFEPGPGQRLMLQAQIDGEVGQGRVQRQRAGIKAQFYLPQSHRRLFYAALALDRLRRPELPDTLLLGADEGLRGYPLRYQSGTRRALFSAEQRFYTDLYVWQLFRVGGALFFDAGRAWGGDIVNPRDAGWLRDAGAGLRVVSVRSAFSNVLHVDLAVPIGAAANIRKVQLNLKTRASF